MDPNSNLNLTTLTLALTKAWGDHTLQVGWDNQTVMTPEKASCRAGLNSNCSEDQMRTYKITRGPYYDADATVAVHELESYQKQLSHLIFYKRCREL